MRTYIQGLRPFSTSIPKTLKKYLKKGGYYYSNIIDNWTKIVSKNVYDSCYPIKIKMGKDMKDGILVLNVIHGKEVEIEYNCIKSIILKIVQDKINVQDKTFPNMKNLKQIEEKMEKINNEQLKTSLNNFLKAYYDKY